MQHTPVMTLQTRMVLTTFLKDPDAELYGRQVCSVTGLMPGTVYPILKRLKNVGWLAARWEERSATDGRGRPPRRYFQLTADGWVAAREAVQERGRW